MTARNSPHLLTKVTLTGVFEFWDLAPRTQDAACASVIDRSAVSASAVKTSDDADKTLSISFYSGRRGDLIGLTPKSAPRPEKQTVYSSRPYGRGMGEFNASARGGDKVSSTVSSPCLPQTWSFFSR